MKDMIYFNGSKMGLEEVTCTCGFNQCTTFNCRGYNRIRKNVTYADVVRIPKRQIVWQVKETMMSRLDNELECFQTIVGGSLPSDYLKIVNILGRQFLSKEAFNEKNITETLEGLIKYTKDLNLTSKIGSLKSESLSVDTTIRNSLSVNFKENVVSQLTEVILPQIKKAFDSTVLDPVDVKIHPDHGNMLLYETGGKFNIHRDKILPFPFEGDTTYDNGSPKWIMFSLVYCLDSNLDNRIFSHEGNTIIYLPPFASPNTKLPAEEIKNFKCIPHIFNDSVIPGEFLGFPSNVKHSSVEIKKLGGYKFALKLDYWVQLKEKPHQFFITDNGFYDNGLKGFEKTPNISSSNLNCNCKICDPYRQRLPVFYYHTLNRLPLNLDVIEHILSFINVKDIVKGGKKINNSKYIRDLGYEYRYPGDEYYNHPDNYYGYSDDDTHCNGDY